MFNKKLLSTMRLSKPKKPLSFMLYKYNSCKQMALNTSVFNKYIANGQGQSYFSTRNFYSYQIGNTKSTEDKRDDQKNNWIKWATGIAVVLGITVHQVYKLLKEPEQPLDDSSFPKEDLFFERTSKQFKDLQSKIGSISKFGGITTVAVVGVPGSGKTQLVLDYLEELKKEFQQDNNYKKSIEIPITIEDIKKYGEGEIKEYFNKPVKTIFWLNASNDQTLQHDYEILAGELKVPINTTRGFDSICEAVFGKLKFRPGWVFVFDNINNKDDNRYENIKKYIPTYGSGKVILLSNESFKTIPEEQEVRVTGLNAESSVHYLNRVLGNNNEQENRRRLVVKLAGLPYALKLVANYLKISESTCEMYLQKIEPRLPLGKYTAEDYKEIYATILNQSINQLISANFLSKNKTICHSVDVTDLLHVCSLFAPNNIPLELITDKNPIVNLRQQEILKIFRDYGLVDYNGTHVNIHSETQLAIQNIFQSKHVLRLGKCIELLEKQINDNNVFRSNKNDIIMHAERIMNSKQLMSNLDFKGMLSLTHVKMGVANFYIQNYGMIDKGEEILKQAKEDLENNLFKENIQKKSTKEICQILVKMDRTLPTRYGHILYLFSRTYCYLQNLHVPSEIEASLERAIEIRQEIDREINKNQIYDDGLNEDGIYTPLYYRSGKALLLLIKSEQEKKDALALEYLNSAEKIITGIALPSKKDDIFHQMVCKDMLANIYLHKARREKNLEVFHLNKALIYSNAVIKELQEPKDEIYKRKIYRKEKFYNTMGKIYSAKNELFEAEKAFKNALPLDKKLNDFALAESYYELANFYYKTNNIVNAKSYIFKSLEVQEKLKLSNHPITQKIVSLKEEIFKIEQVEVIAENLSKLSL